MFIFDTEQVNELWKLCKNAGDEMNVDPVVVWFYRRAMEFVPCTCDEAYTSRNLTAPDCPQCNMIEIDNELLQANQRIK